MTLPSISLLVESLQHPHRLENFSVGQWNNLIPQGRSADLLARMGAVAHRQGCHETAIPPGPAMHVQSALILVTRQQQELRREVQHIAVALKDTGVPLVLLKGAAYVLADLHAAAGRLVSDVDILVPHAELSKVEAALMMGGWKSSTQTDYDQHYYRTWMHELPPMHHIHRGTVIDVHHAILPLSARLHPSPQRLLAAARPIEGHPSIKVLAPIDMVLHSAAHLFHEGELEKGLRGLVDLDALIREFSVEPGFWDRLVYRAVELELVRPLFYAIRYASIMLSTPVPALVQAAIHQTTGASPGRLQLHVMDALYLRALRPPHESTSDRWTPLARWLLYVRSHWLKMPPWLLTVHLVRKMMVSKPKEVESK
jgi:hypothetical protein